MHLPAIQGLIRRRILVNFRLDPERAQRALPWPLRPKLAGDFAVAGVCLIRLEQLRPRGVAWPVGLASENAAHRMAVEWTDRSGQEHEGVYISRRDTSSTLARLAGGRIFPGEHGAARFCVRDEEGRIDFWMHAADGCEVRLRARPAEALPAGSVFSSLGEASAFFEAGSAGYSVSSDPSRLDGLRLVTRSWRVEPLAVEEVYASAFEGAAFDSALIVRDVEHEWQSLPALRVGGMDARSPALALPRG
jgi:hypothetical protein